MSKQIIKKNIKAIDIFKSYGDIRQQMDEVQMAMGKKKAYHTSRIQREIAR